MGKMIDKTGKGKTGSAWGKAIPEIAFDYAWTEYPDVDTLKDAGDTLSLEQQRKVRNAQRQNKQRQAAMDAALVAAGYEKPNLQNDPVYRLKQTYKILLTATKPGTTELLHTPESAKALASSAVGVEWPEDDSDDE